MTPDITLNCFCQTVCAVYILIVVHLTLDHIQTNSFDEPSERLNDDNLVTYQEDSQTSEDRDSIEQGLAN